MDGQPLFLKRGEFPESGQALPATRVGLPDGERKAAESGCKNNRIGRVRSDGDDPIVYGAVR